MKDKKIVLVFAGPSGAGKSTLIKYTLSKFSYVGLTVSCTTRARRRGEIDKVDYHFISHESFDKNIDDGNFIEYVNCFGNKYGTLKSAIFDTLEKNKICILDIDFAGSFKVLSQKVLGDQIFCSGVLILPPSLSTLKKRLINRHSETEESLEVRLSDSFNYHKNIANFYDVIINGNLDDSKKSIDKIIQRF